MMSEPTFVASRDGLCGFVLVVEDGRVDAYTLPATCWAYCKTQLYAARRPERAPPPVFGGIDCGDASSRLCCAAAAHSTANLSNISRCLGLSVCSAASMQCRTNQS
jgi:hypothetical protein